VLGVSSPEAKTLQQQMVTRMAIMSDPSSVLVDNPQLLQSIQTTDGIAEQVINDATASVTKSVQAQATARRQAAMRDTGLMLAAIVIVMGIVLVMARALVRPLRVLRDGALKVAHTDLEDEITRIRAGGEPVPMPLAVYTTEEIGQVAHAVNELHAQALLLAGDEARLRLLVNDMFETMSRRSRSLVDQQLSLIDRLERNEEDADRLDSLFRLDHLAARLRRNSANLLVLAGAQLSRDQREPVELSNVINAAVSEVEDYRRVQIAHLPESTVLGAAVGSIIHLLAELIDNALRYSPPTAPVLVSAARGGDGGVLLWVSDSGLGMNDGDRRMANMRLQSGGEVTPENARHMGLFVVGRLAVRHGLRVGLRGPTPDDDSPGTTAEVYLPPSVLVEGLAAGFVPAAPIAAPAPVPQARLRVTPPPEPAEPPDAMPPELPAAHRNGSGGSGPPVTLLPRRTPGSSGITDVPAQGAEAAEQRERRELATPWWEKNGVQQELTQPEPSESSESSASSAPPEPREPEPTAAPVPSDTSGFFAARPLESRSRLTEPNASVPAAPDDEDVIYQNMLAEWLSDPHDLVQSPNLDWQSVWDRGWSLAAEAEEKPVESHTDHGLPVRTPGAQLVPGAGASSRPDGADEDPDEAAAVRDPAAVRASIGGHFGGVHSGRSHARDTDRDEQG
jgi:signal transduction histidine kinase